MPNTNCLEGMRCPKCGSEEPLLIEVTAYEEVWDSGVESRPYDTEWNDSSPCICGMCAYEGTVGTFTENHTTLCWQCKKNTATEECGRCRLHCCPNPDKSFIEHH